MHRAAYHFIKALGVPSLMKTKRKLTRKGGAEDEEDNEADGQDDEGEGEDKDKADIDVSLDVEASAAPLMMQKRWLVRQSLIMIPVILWASYLASSTKYEC